jgi:hypothetical protein
MNEVDGPLEKHGRALSADELTRLRRLLDGSPTHRIEQSHPRNNLHEDRLRNTNSRLDLTQSQDSPAGFKE